MHAGGVVQIWRLWGPPPGRPKPQEGLAEKVLRARELAKLARMESAAATADDVVVQVARAVDNSLEQPSAACIVCPYVAC
jgi:hypothetical protein